MLRDKLLAQLVTKYPGVSKQFLGLWADKLLAKVTEESQIQGVIDELNNLPFSITDLATEFQKEGDRRVTQSQKEAAEKKPNEGGKTEGANQEPKTDDTATLLKSLLQEVQTMKADKVQATMKEKAAAKLKDIPAEFYSEWALPTKDEDLDGFVTKVETQYGTLKQTLTTQGLLNSTPPGGGGPSTQTPNEKAIAADIEAWAGAGKEPKK